MGSFKKNKLTPEIRNRVFLLLRELSVVDYLSCLSTFNSLPSHIDNKFNTGLSPVDYEVLQRVAQIKIDLVEVSQKIDHLYKDMERNVWEPKK